VLDAQLVRHHRDELRVRLFLRITIHLIVSVPQGISVVIKLKTSNIYWIATENLVGNFVFQLYFSQTDRHVNTYL